MIAFAVLMLLQYTEVLYDEAPLERVIPPETAAAVFVDTCWKGLRDRAAFESAIGRSPLHFRSAPSEPPLMRRRSDRADIWYRDGQCSMRVLFASEHDADIYIDHITSSLGVTPPARSLAGDVPTTLVKWQDTPVADSLNRMQAEIEKTTPSSKRPIRADIHLGAWREPK